MLFQISSRRENSPNIALPDSENNTSRSLNREDVADLPLFRILVTIFQKVPRTKFLESDRLFCFVSICRFWQLQEPFSNNY